MKFEIRRVQNGVVLRVEPDYPDAETEEGKGSVITIDTKRCFSYCWFHAAQIASSVSRCHLSAMADRLCSRRSWPLPLSSVSTVPVTN